MSDDLVSAAYKTKLRDNHPHVFQANLSIIKPVVLYVGRIVGTPDLGARTITVTNVSGNIAKLAAGQTVFIGKSAGDYSVAKRRLRNAAGQVLTLDENSTTFAAGDYVTVVDGREFWNVWPYIEYVDPFTFYKDFDVAYSDQNLYPQPVAIAGPNRAGIINPALGMITFSLNASLSYAMAYGATISSCIWACDSNQAIIANPNVAVTTITLLSAGTYWIKLTVTDSNSKTQSTWRVIRAHSVDDPPIVQFSITSPPISDWSTGGWRAAVSIPDAYTLADYPDNALVMLWGKQYFQGTESYYSDNMRLCGHFRRMSLRQRKGTGELSFDIETLNGVMANRSMMSVSLEYKVKPKAWYQLYKLTVARALHHYLRWHTTLFDMTDVFLPTDETTELVAVDDFDDGDIYGQIENFGYTHSIFAHAGFDRHNRLYIQRDIHTLGVAARNALAQLITLTVEDIQPEFEVVLNNEPVMCHVIVSGGVRNPLDNTMTPYIAQAPGEIRANEGVSKKPFDFQVLPSQVAANVLAGRALALANRYVDEVRIKLAGNYGDVFDTMPQQWVVLPDLPNDRGYDLAGRYTIKNITTPMDINSGAAGCELVLVPDVDSIDGIPGPYPPTIEEPPEGGSEPEPPPWTPPPPELPITEVDMADVMAATTTDVRSSEDAEDAEVHWVSKYAGITGTINDACTVRGDAGKNVVYVVTDTAVWCTTDFQSAAPTWIVVLDLTSYTSATVPDGYIAPIATCVVAGQGFVYILVNDITNGTDSQTYFMGWTALTGWYETDIETRLDAVKEYTATVVPGSIDGNGTITMPHTRLGDDVSTYNPWCTAVQIISVGQNAWLNIPVADPTTILNGGGTNVEQWVGGNPRAWINEELAVPDKTKAYDWLNDYFNNQWQSTTYLYASMPKDAMRVNWLIGVNHTAAGAGLNSVVSYALWNIPSYNLASAMDCGWHNTSRIYIGLETRILCSEDGGLTWEDYITSKGAYDIECHECQGAEDTDITFWATDGHLYRTAGVDIGTALYLETAPANVPHRIASDPILGWPIWALASGDSGYLLIKRDQSSTTTPDLAAAATSAISVVCRPGTTMALRRIYYMTHNDIRYSEDGGETFVSKLGDWAGYGNPKRISPFV